MKRTLMLIGLFLALGAARPAKAAPPVFEGGSGVFYSSLSPYGAWVDCSFGRAWRPMHVAHGWRPYSSGRWAWTDYGWYWVSYEPFGWATFHYGRWYLDDQYGWIWIPGDVWGPSWVEWRYDEDYIGWAPLSPYAVYDAGIGINGRGWVAPVHYWNFVGCRNFTSYHIDEYMQPPERARRIFGHTRGTLDIRTDGGRVINRGIDVRDVERRTRSRVDRMDVVMQDQRSGERIIRDRDRGRIEAYRPRIEGQTGPDTRPAPTGGRRPDARVPQIERQDRSRAPAFIPRQPTERRLERTQQPRQEWRARAPQRLPQEPLRGGERMKPQPQTRSRDKR